MDELDLNLTPEAEEELSNGKGLDHPDEEADDDKE